MARTRTLPFLELLDLRREDVRQDLLPSVVGALMAVPQGMAYALIAGLPPIMGLYAAAVPAIVGSLLRSSRLVVVGPTNAISLILAVSVAAWTGDPVTAAATLAVFVGVLQISAAAFKLDAMVDYISTAVVAGYITGAAALIAVGQLPSATGTAASSGDILGRFVHWLATLTQLSVPSTALALVAVAMVVYLRPFVPKGVPAVLAMGTGIVLTWVLGLRGWGVTVVGDVGSITAGLPGFSVPQLAGLWDLAPAAVAAMIVSLAESSSVSRALSARTGQRIDVATDFVGLGAANVAAGLFGGYPVSGSLGRSALNYQLGAKTRVAGMLSGVWVLLVPLFFAGVVDWTPLPTLAGIILVLAFDLVDVDVIRALLRSGPADGFAFAGTVLGTWLLPLDEAIFVGVGISIVLFLRRVRMLVVRELRIDEDGQLREIELDAAGPPRCIAIRILHVEGPLFFGAAGELDAALGRFVDDPEVKVLVLRMKRAQGLDYTTAVVLRQAHEQMASTGRHLILVGMRADVMQRLEDIGLTQAFGRDDLFPTRPGWFEAMKTALRRALDTVRAEHPAGHGCADCPVARYLEGAVTEDIG